MVHWCIGALAQQSIGEFSVHFRCFLVLFGAFSARRRTFACKLHRADSCSAHLSLHRVCAIDSLSAANVAAIWACMRDCAAPSHWEILSKRQRNDDLLLLSVSRGLERGHKSPPRLSSGPARPRGWRAACESEWELGRKICQREAAWKWPRDSRRPEGRAAWPEARQTRTDWGCTN